MLARSFAGFVLGFTLAPVLNAQAPSLPFSQMEVLQISEGPNSLELNGAAPTDLILSGWVENYNAHGFHYFTFFVQYPDSEDGRTRWDLVPFVMGDRTDKGLTTSGGADCKLHDLRVLRPRSGPRSVTIVVADRDLGNSYADRERVVFSVYEVGQNSTMTPGRPGIAFYRTRTIVARARYCDVNDAFVAELGIR